MLGLASFEGGPLGCRLNPTSEAYVSRPKSRTRDQKETASLVFREDYGFSFGPSFH
jgi:hypothetical protein